MLTLGEGGSIEPEVDLTRALARRRRAARRPDHRRSRRPCRGAQHAVPGRVRRARTRRCAPARPSSGPCRPASTGPARRRSAAASPGARGTTSVLTTSPSGCSGMPPSPSVIALLPLLATLGALAVAPSAGGRRRLDRAAARARPLVLLPVATSSGWSLLALLVRRRSSGCSGWDSRGLPPDPRSARVAGVVDAAGAGRGPHLAVPAVLELADAGVAARPRRPGRAATSRPRPCC